MRLQSSVTTPVGDSDSIDLGQDSGISYFNKLFFKYKFIYFNWRLITLQYCIGFAIHQHESATGIRVPHPEPPSLLPPRTIPLGHPSAPAPSILYPASNLDR